MDSKTSTFFKRTFSTVILLGLLGGAVALNQFWGYAILIAILSNLTSYEWYHMQKEQMSPSNRLIALFAGLLYPWLLAWVSYQNPGNHAPVVHTIIGSLVAYGILVFVKEVLSMDYAQKNGTQAVSEISKMLLAFIYPVWLFCFAYLFLLGGDADIKMLLLLILVTKLSDIFAYVSGVLLGRRFIKRPFSPTVSPKKSWEGIIGSFILTAVACFFLADALIGLAPCNLGYLIYGYPFIFFFSVMGDLAGSLIKRGLMVKDSGSLLPGIGGIFDLIDSPAFTVSLYLLAVSIFI